MNIQSSESIQLYKLPDRDEKKFLPFGSVNASKKVTNDDIEVKKAKLRKAAEGFEAIFTRLILKSMRTSFTNEGMFGTGSIGEIYSDMMDNAIAEKMSVRGELGLADANYKQMVKSIEFERNSDTPEDKNIIKDRVLK